MKIDDSGTTILSIDEVVECLYDGVSTTFTIDDPEECSRYESAVKFFGHQSILNQYTPTDPHIEHSRRQSIWNIPEEYQRIDIVEYLAERCPDDFAYQERLAIELSMFEDHDFLRMVIYVVSTLKENGVVIGVGRGSACSSLIFYLIGAHRIDPIKYNLDYNEFFKLEETIV